jgi:hypothetical protein
MLVIPSFSYTRIPQIRCATTAVCEHPGKKSAGPRSARIKPRALRTRAKAIYAFE